MYHLTAITVVEEYVNSTSYYQTLYLYDNASNLLRITYPDSSTVDYSYDDLNRMTGGWLLCEHDLPAG